MLQDKGRFHHCTSFNQLTRKSSCVHARGIPTAAYQVLLGGVPPIGVPPEEGYPSSGYPPPGPGWGTLPWLDLAGVPPPPEVWKDRQMDGWTDTCQNITFPRTTYAVGNNTIFKSNKRPNHLDYTTVHVLGLFAGSIDSK